MKKNILNYSYRNLLEEFRSINGRGEYFIKPLYRQVMKKGIFSPESLPAFANSPKILKIIKDNFHLQTLNLAQKHSSGETVKLIFITHDNLKVEAVVIPMKTYYTLCVSSQIGCNMGCSFCQTAEKGRVRNLETHEIISQFFYARLTAALPIRNIVFMGMGEPLDNLQNVITSITIMTENHGFNLSRGHITLSTCGLIPQLKEFLSQEPNCHLALSLNAADNTIRDHLMPVNRSYPIEDLISFSKEYCKKDKIVFVEYVMISGINDSEKDAEKLANLLTNLNVRINLIPLNPKVNSKMQPPSDNSFELFYQHLRSKGLHVIRRNSKGDKIRAACGQLGKH